MASTTSSTDTGLTVMLHGADGALDKAQTAAHAAVNSIADSAEEATRKAKPAIDKVASIAHQAVDKAADTAAPAADWLGEKGASLDAMQKKLAADTCSYVSANPFKALGMAVVAGFVLGRIIR